jgi:hypothetical protein
MSDIVGEHFAAWSVLSTDAAVEHAALATCRTCGQALHGEYPLRAA